MPMSGFELQALWDLAPLILGGVLLVGLVSVLLLDPSRSQEAKTRRLDRRSVQPRRRENRPVAVERRRQNRRLYI